MTDLERIIAVKKLREEFPDFISFLRYGMGKLGFKCTPVQEDIASFLDDTSIGNRKMIQAQRGQAKTTICALYCLWRIIHHCAIRILIVTASADHAENITKVMFGALTDWDKLECLRPGKNDRQSTKKFDVHKTLKGLDISPTVTCAGVATALAGKRADLIIADDIENRENSRTDDARDKLIHSANEFPNLANDGGDIIFLGTPQSRKSIYKELTSKGYVVRIWTGRVPKKTEVMNYEGCLAPYILDKIKECSNLDYIYGLDLDSGPAIDPIINPEETLVQAEMNDRADFRLQRMLDTTLSDMNMFPIRCHDLLWMNVDPLQGIPLTVHTTKNHTSKIDLPKTHTHRGELFMADVLQGECVPITRVLVAVDPSGAGENADETGYAVVGTSGDRLICLEVGGIPGGYNSKSFEQLSNIITKWNPSELLIEKNFGYGAFKAVWENHALFEKHHNLPIVEVTNTRQKEERICDALEPLVNSKKLIMNMDILEDDWASAMKHPKDRRSYSLMTQMADITREKDALKHDDRIDALAMAVTHLKDAMYQDTEAIERDIRDMAEQEWWCNRMGYNSWDEYIDTCSHVPGYERFKQGTGIKVNEEEELAETRISEIDKIKQEYGEDIFEPF